MCAVPAERVRIAGALLGFSASDRILLKKIAAASHRSLTKMGGSLYEPGTPPPRTRIASTVGMRGNAVEERLTFPTAEMLPGSTAVMLVLASLALDSTVVRD